MSRKARDTYHHGDLRTALLQAGLTLLDAEGIDAVTIRAVAREAGVAHSAPANHFKDRSALLGGLATLVFEDMATKVEKALSRAGASRPDRLHTFADAVVRYGVRHPHRYRLLWRWDSMDTKTGVEAAGTVLYERVRAALGERDANARVNVESEIIAAWSLIHGYVSLRIEGTLVDGKDETSGRPRSEAIVEVLLRGIEPRK